MSGSLNREESMHYERFHGLWARCAPSDQGRARELYQELRAHYSEPGRSYHTPKHVQFCLSHFDEVRDLLQWPDSVELAIWYHDIIYDPRADDNERRSADYFRRHAGPSLEDALVRRVVQLIIATEHREVPDDPDEAFMVDIDLASFARPWRDFCSDSDRVRAEFPQMGDAEFTRGQARFLQSLLDREHFYATAFFQERYEAMARSNVSRRLASMLGVAGD